MGLTELWWWLETQCEPLRWSQQLFTAYSRAWEILSCTIWDTFYPVWDRPNNFRSSNADRMNYLYFSIIHNIISRPVSKLVDIVSTLDRLIKKTRNGRGAVVIMLPAPCMCCMYSSYDQHCIAVSWEIFHRWVDGCKFCRAGGRWYCFLISYWMHGPSFPLFGLFPVSLQCFGNCICMMKEHPFHLWWYRCISTTNYTLLVEAAQLHGPREFSVEPEYENAAVLPPLSFQWDGEVAESSSPWSLVESVLPFWLLVKCHSSCYILTCCPFLAHRVTRLRILLLRSYLWASIRNVVQTCVLWHRETPSNFDGST